MDRVVHGMWEEGLAGLPSEPAGPQPQDVFNLSRPQLQPTGSRKLMWIYLWELLKRTPE